VKCAFGVEIYRTVLLTLFRARDWRSKLAAIEIVAASFAVLRRCDSSRRVMCEVNVVLLIHRRLRTLKGHLCSFDIGLVEKNIPLYFSEIAF